MWPCYLFNQNLLGSEEEEEEGKKGGDFGLTASWILNFLFLLLQGGSVTVWAWTVTGKTSVQKTWAPAGVAMEIWLFLP